MLDDGHAAAEASVRLGEFEADVPAAEDDEVSGQSIEFEQLDVRERSGIRQAGDRWNRGAGAQIEEDAAACQHAPSAPSFNRTSSIFGATKQPCTQ